MAVRELQGPPRALTTYARAALPLVPGASRLPFVGGRGTEVPDLTLALRGATTDPADLAAYAKVCGFRLRDEVPATWPHIQAFGLHMALMTDAAFPFPAVGLVHLANRIEQQRPIRVGEALDLTVRATPVEPHPKGRTFSLVTEAAVEGETVWTGTSTMLRRGGGAEEEAKRRGGRKPTVPAPSATWRLPGDLGRRYASVSGDRNPIHLTDLSAKAFGFKRAIAHGMWTAARCLAALEGRLPDAYAFDVQFRKPILLPAAVTFGHAEASKGGVRFTVRDERTGTPHLDGTVEPLKTRTTKRRTS